MEQELYHYGVLGMKWGIRRYQNADGSLTAAGRKRYKSSEAAEVDKHLEAISQTRKKSSANTYVVAPGPSAKLHNKQVEKLHSLRSESYQAIQQIFDKNTPELKLYRDQIEDIIRKQEELYARYRDKWVKSHSKEFNGDLDEADAFYRNVVSKKDVKFVSEYRKLQAKSDELVNKSNDLTKKVIEDVLGTIGSESINSAWSKWQRNKAFSKYGVYLPGRTTKEKEIWSIIGPYGSTDKH